MEMDTSLFLAKVFGIYFIVLGLAMLINRKGCQQVGETILQTPAVAFLAAFMTLIIGILLIVAHNIWQANWTLIITLLAWLIFIKGTVRTIWPKIDTQLKGILEKNSLFILFGILYLLLGSFLAYKGYTWS